MPGTVEQSRTHLGIYRSRTFKKEGDVPVQSHFSRQIGLAFLVKSDVVVQPRRF